MLYYIVKLCSALVCALPVAARRICGNLLGEICWLFVARKRKQMAIGNIMQAFGVAKEEAVSIAKQSTVRFGRMLLEVLAFPVMARRMNEYVSISGKEYLTAALSHGRGVILATAHSGNWELLGAALALEGFPIAAVAQRQTNAQMDRFINEYRALMNIHVTYKKGVREMIRILTQGKTVGMLMDQDAGTDGIFVDFFARSASTVQGPAYLARLQAAPIVPVFITENTDGTHTVILQEVVWPQITDCRKEDILVTTRKLTAIIEQHIRSHPTEWFWLHNRWKTVADDDRS